MNKKSIVLSLFVCMALLTGCGKPPEVAAEPAANKKTWYVFNEYQFLMLTGPEEGEFKEVAEALSGPAAEVIEAVEKAESMERTPENINALAAGYELCGDLGMAKATLESAWKLEMDKGTRTCIENNYAIVISTFPDREKADEWYAKALENVGEDKMRQLTIQSSNESSPWLNSV